MRRLVYKSEAAVEVTPTVMTNILRSARTNNQRLYVTGMLVYNNGYFLQCLEGTHPEIEEAMEKVHSASQHKNIMTLSDQKVQSRYFPDWSMGVDSSVDALGKGIIEPRLFPLPDPNGIVSGDIAELVLKVYAKNRYPGRIPNN